MVRSLSKYIQPLAKSLPRRWPRVVRDVLVYLAVAEHRAETVTERESYRLAFNTLRLVHEGEAQPYERAFWNAYGISVEKYLRRRADAEQDAERNYVFQAGRKRVASTGVQRDAPASTKALPAMR